MNQFRGSQTQWLHVSELKKRQCHLSLEEYTTLTSWLPSSVLPREQQSRPNSAHSSSVIVPSEARGPIRLPPCIAGQVIKTGEHNCLVLKSLAHHNTPDANISFISDQQLATHLCQCRAVFPLQISADIAPLVECLVPLRRVVQLYSLSQEYLIVRSCSDTNAPLTALPLALVRDTLLGCDRDTLCGACSRPRWVVSTEDWYAGYTFPQSPASSQIPSTWQLQDTGDRGQLKMTGLVKYLSKRLMPLCFSPPVVLHRWQTDLPLPPKVVIDITNHLPRQLQSPDRWEVMQRNGRVWVVENNRRLVQLDAAQYNMLLTQYNGLDASSAPPAEFLRLLCASCRAQQAADQDCFMHWSRHLLASIHESTGVRSLIGASAVTHNPHFLFFLSPNVEDQQLGAIVEWPPEPVLLVLDAFKPSLRQQLLQQASRHSPGAWILLQHSDRQNNQDLAELKRLHAQKYVELPKKSMVLHREGCWQTASWDIFPNGNTTQLWKITPPNEQPAVPAVQPITMQQFLERWESTRYAFHWCKDPVPRLLQVHRNHQQDSMRWGWDGLVAGTDGSVDERTEHMGTGYVVGNDRVPMMILSSPIGGPLASIRSEAAGLLQLLRDFATEHGRHVRLLVFIDCLVLLDILRRWGMTYDIVGPYRIRHRMYVRCRMSTYNIVCQTYDVVRLLYIVYDIVGIHDVVYDIIYFTLYTTSYTI